MLERWRRDDMRVVPVLIETALIDETYCRFPDPNSGPHSIKLSELQFETFERQAISLVDRPKQNLFMERLAYTLLTRATHADLPGTDEVGGGAGMGSIGRRPPPRVPDARTTAAIG